MFQMFVHKCNFLQLLLKINAIFSIFIATKTCPIDQYFSWGDKVFN